MAETRKIAVDQILAAAGEAATVDALRAAVVAWCQAVVDARTIELVTPHHADVEVRVAWELLRYVQLVLVAFEDPQKFFREMLPAVDSEFRNTLEGPADLFAMKAGSLIRRWGFGILLNDEFRERLANLSSRDFNVVFSVADVRKRFREGAPAKFGARPLHLADRLNEILAAVENERGVGKRGNRAEALRRLQQLLAAEGRNISMKTIDNQIRSAMANAPKK